MQQFRRFPRFDEIEEAEPVVGESVDTPSREVTGAVPFVNPQTTGRMPVFLFTGSHPVPVTDHLSAIAKRPDSSPKLASTLETVMKKDAPTNRLVVIPAEKKRKKKVAPTQSRHLNSRTRHIIVLLATLSILIGTLITLVPLYGGPGGSNLLADFGNWIRSAQIDAQIQGHMINIAQTLNSSPNNLPPMSIAKSQYVAIAQQDALDAGISPVYFVRQIQQESGFNPNAVSPTNAMGIAQFEPSTAAGLGINPLDPIQALRAAAQMMARYSHMYGGYAKALAAYNAGSGTLLNAENNCGVNWLSCMPGQTQNYVYVIMGI